jgi:hypothetical protein
MVHTSLIEGLFYPHSLSSRARFRSPPVPFDRRRPILLIGPVHVLVQMEFSAGTGIVYPLGPIERFQVVPSSFPRLRLAHDWIIPLSEAHLRKTLTLWMPHYNRGSPHAALRPGIPEPQSELPAPLQRHRHQLDRPASVVARPILNGLHHEYRVAALAA